MPESGLHRRRTGSRPDTFLRMGNLLGYARMSTVDEHPDRQVQALTAAGCTQVYTDRATGSLEPRPELEKLLSELSPGDTMVICSLDRPGRSMRHILSLVAGLSERGIGLQILDDGIDTEAAGGSMVYSVFAALTGFERALIRERTNAALAAARARGRTGGRPALLTEEQTAQAREMYALGEKTVSEIGEVFGVSRTTVYRALEHNGDAPVPPRRPTRRPVPERSGTSS